MSPTLHFSETTDAFIVKQRRIGNITTCRLASFQYFYEDTAGKRRLCGSRLSSDAAVTFNPPNDPLNPFCVILIISLLELLPSDTIMGEFTSYDELKNRVNQEGYFLYISASNDDCKYGVWIDADTAFTYTNDL